jgi:restriction system protein|tara:strand:+ start:1683 stop:1892 length:210 start_codon:yes stop_codon:yes gene_type:complete
MTKSKSKITAEKTIFAAFKILRDNGGELRGKYVIDKIRETVEFNEHEKLKDEQKSMMPIQQISFLGGNE